MSKEHATPEVKPEAQPGTIPVPAAAAKQVAAAVDKTTSTTAASEHPGAVASREADKAATEEVKEPTHLDFGKAGKLKIASAGSNAWGVNGAEHSVTVEIGDEEGTYTFQNVPARFLK